MSKNLRVHSTNLQARRSPLADLDKQAHRFLPVVDERLLAYVREHQSQILLPETPLEKRAAQIEP